MLALRGAYRPVLRSAVRINTQSARGHFEKANSVARNVGRREVLVRQLRLKSTPAAGQLTLPTRKRMLLPNTITPTHYDITLQPDLVKFTFGGNVVIELDVLKSTNSIEFHAKEIKFSKRQTFVTQGGSTLKITSIKENKKDNIIKLTLPNKLSKGKAQLTIKFDGILNDQMAGFYRSSYKDNSGKDQIMATTQLEAIDARRCYPCWDEPAHKAVFTVSMIHDSSLTAISNMPVSRSERLSDDKTLTKFLPSPVMSTYLLAFCLGKFEFIQRQTSDGTLIRCLCVPGKDRINQMEFAMKVAVDCLEFYNKYFGIKYPLPKLDMIAIPDFSAGAMENWGLITYREVLMLIDKDKASVDQLQLVATVVTHEIAHQWFGNLVTMQWWDGLWLNEGFANWMQTYSADALFPKWNIWEQYISQEQSLALRLDSLRSSHPIEVDIYRAETVEEVFDHISYSKGGCVVRLVHSLIGQTAFRNGLRQYLSKHSYANTESDHLWQAWEQAAKEEGITIPLTKIMSTWTHQMGFPLLTVSEGSKKGFFNVSQEWFLSDGSKKPNDDKKLWYVPLVTNTTNGPPKYLTTRKMEIDLSGKSAFTKLNFGQSAPLRVKYSPKMLSKLCTALQQGKLPAIDRIGLLSDYNALANANKIQVTELISLLVMYTKTEDNDKVWEIISGCWKSLLDGLRKVNTTTHSNAKKTVASLLQKKATDLGWVHRPDDSDNTKRLRGLILGLYVEVSTDSSLVKKAGFSLKKLPKTADIRSIAMKHIVRHDTTQSSAKHLREMYRKSDDNVFKNSVHGAVAQTTLVPTLKETLSWGLNSGEVRTQDYIYIVSHTAMNPKGAKLTTEFIRDNYSKLYEALGKTSMMLFGRFAKVSFGGCDSVEEIEKMKLFWESKRLDLLKLTIQQTVESSNLRLRIIEQLRDSDASNPDYWKLL